MTIIPDTSENSNNLELNGNSVLDNGTSENKFTLKSIIRPSLLATAAGTLDADDLFGSIFDINNNVLVVGLPDHNFNSSGTSVASAIGMAYVYEKTENKVIKKTKKKVRHKQTFNYTGAIQEFTVPDTVETLRIQMIAGGGGGSSATNIYKGGNGGYIAATVAVKAGHTYDVIVGQGGIAGGTTSSFGGGGFLTSAGGTGGSGGGRSAFSDKMLGDLITAGAGGGASSNGNGGYGGIVAGNGVASKAADAVDVPIHAIGANGMMVGYNNTEKVDELHYRVKGTEAVLDRLNYNIANYFYDRYRGGNASNFSATGSFSNGAGGAGYAGGAAGPDGYEYYDSISTSTPVNRDSSGSGSGGSSWAYASPSFSPIETEREMVTNVIAYNGGSFSLNKEFDGFGIGGTGTNAGANGVVVIEWDEYEDSTDRVETNWNWTQTASLDRTGTNSTIASDLFGSDVATNGTWIAVGCPQQDYDADGANSVTNAGAVFMYTKVSGVWTQQQKIVEPTRAASNLFGSTVVLVDDTLYIGSIGTSLDSSGSNSVSAAGAIYIYTLNGGTWVYANKITPTGTNSRIASDNFGYRITATSQYIAVSSKNGYDTSGATLTSAAGTVWLFNASTGSQIDRIIGSRTTNANFGSAIHLKGSILSIEGSGNSEKVIYELDSSSGTWSTTFSSVDSTTIPYVMYSKMSDNAANPATTSKVSGYNITYSGRETTSQSNEDDYLIMDRAFKGNYNIRFETDGLNRGFWATTSNGTFTNLNSFTFEQWVNIIEPYSVRDDGSLETQDQALPMVRRPGAWGLWHTRDQVEINGGSIYFEAQNEVGSKVKYEFGKIQRRTWTHLALVRDGNEIRTYVNGNLRNTYDVTGINFVDSDTTISWGYNSSIDSKYPPKFVIRDFIVRPNAFYKNSFSINHGADITPIAPASMGRGNSTFVLDSKTILSGLPTSYSDVPVNLPESIINLASTQHVESTYDNSGQVEITSKIDSNWITNKDIPLVMPGYVQLRQLGAADFGTKVNITNGSLIVSAPGSTSSHHDGNADTYATGKAYVFDIKNDDIPYTGAVVPKSRNTFNNSGNRAFASYSDTKSDSSVIFTDSNYFNIAPIYIEFKKNTPNDTVTAYYDGYRRYQYNVETSGRYTKATIYDAKVYGIGSEVIKNVVSTSEAPLSYVPTSAVTEIPITWPSITSPTYLGSLTGPIKIVNDVPYASAPIGALVDPNWGSVTSGYVNPYIYNEVTKTNDLTISITIPGNNSLPLNSNDLFGYSVKTTGTEIFVGAPQSDKTKYNNDTGSNYGAIEKFVYREWLNGWNSEELITPNKTSNNMYFGAAFDVSGNFIVSRTQKFTTSGTYAESMSYIQERTNSDSDFSIISTESEDLAQVPYLYNSVKFFSDGSNNLLIGNPTTGSGIKTNVGYVSRYEFSSPNTFTKNATQYVPSVPVNGRYDSELFATSMSSDNGNVLIGVPGYSRITNDTAILADIGAGMLFTKNNTTGYYDSTQILKKESSTANSKFGTKVQIKGNVATLAGPIAATTSLDIYNASNGIYSVTSSLTGNTTTLQGIGIVSDEKIIVGDISVGPTTSVKQITTGGFVDINYSSSTWTRNTTSNFVPQHTNGAYDKGVINYTSYNNNSLARNTNALFGTSLLLSDDKKFLLIGAPGHTYRVDPSAAASLTGYGAVFAYYYDEDTATFRLNTKINDVSNIASQNFGSNINQVSTTEYAISSNKNSGVAGQFTRYQVTETTTNVDATWLNNLTITNTTNSDKFGADISYDSVRDLFYVGSPGKLAELNGNSIDSGQFDTVTPAGVRTAYINNGLMNNRSSNDKFGTSVDIKNGFLAVGATGYEYDEAGVSVGGQYGAVFAFKQTSNDMFSLVNKLTFGGTQLYHGNAVFLSNDDLVIFNGTASPKVFEFDGSSFSISKTVNTPATLAISAGVASANSYAWDPTTGLGANAVTTGTQLNLKSASNSMGGAIQVERNTDGSYTVLNSALGSQIVAGTGIVDEMHTVGAGNEKFGTSGVAFNDDGTMIAIAAPDDGRNPLTSSNIGAVGTGTHFGKIWIYKADATLANFIYHSYIINPVVSSTALSTFGTSISWKGNKLSVTSYGNLVYVYEMVDDTFWKLAYITSSENAPTTATLINDGDGIVMGVPTSSGYPYLTGSGVAHVQQFNNDTILGSSRGVHAGADAEVYSSIQFSAGGGGAGLIGGRSASPYNNTTPMPAQGGSNLVPTGGTYINSNDYTRANSTDTYAYGAGGSVSGASGENARIVITANTETTVFDFTGADQEYIVPAGITAINVKMWGAGGGASYITAGFTTTRTGKGGAGAYVSATLVVTPGETLTLMVGSGGVGGIDQTNYFNRLQNRRYGLGGLGGITTSSGIDGAGNGGGLAGILRNDEFIMIAGGGAGGSAGLNVNLIQGDGEPGGYDHIADSMHQFYTMPDYDLVIAPGTINSRLSNDYFGYSVAISDNNKIYVGAPGQNYDSTGDRLPDNSGVVFVYNKQNNLWTYDQKITSSLSAANENFGHSITVDSDGNRLIVITMQNMTDLTGSTVSFDFFSNTNSKIELFGYSNGEYSNISKNQTPTTTSGRSAQFLEDDKVVLGTPTISSGGINSGGISTYKIATPSMTLLEETTGTGISNSRFEGDKFGTSVLINGSNIYVGAPYHDYTLNGAIERTDQGAVFEFKKNGSTYTYVTKLTLEDDSTLVNYGSSLQMIDNVLYVGIDNEYHLVEVVYNDTLSDWEITKHIESENTDSTIIMISNDSLIQLDPLSDIGLSTQIEIENSGLAKTYSVDNLGALTDLNKDYSIPGTSSGRGENDNFGYSVYATTDFAVVGAPGHDKDISGNILNKPGVLVTFDNSSGNWKPETKLVADSNSIAGYGKSLAGKETWVMTGGNNPTDGNVRVYQRIAANNWEIKHDMTGSGSTGDSFGNSVSVATVNKFIVGLPSADGTISGSVVENSGVMNTYIRTSDTWTEADQISAQGLSNGRNSGDYFGYSIDANKNYIVVGAPTHGYDQTGFNEISQAGAVWVFLRNANEYSFVAKIVSPSRVSNGQYGYSVAINSNSNQIAIGETGTNSVHIYGFDGETPLLIQTITKTVDVNEVFGTTMSFDNNVLLVGSANAQTDENDTNALTNAGAAYVYQLSNGNWELFEKVAGFTDENGDPLTNSRNANDLFGFAIDVDENGGVIIGAPGHAYDTTGTNSVTNAGAAFFKKYE
jgi:Glycine rich protein/FG-GAP repeat